ncbi:MAG: ribosome biogenesis GTPase Der [Patescibacteria group bacterium]|nr:ribosome biogenesis GTPase Der [Patescibacteria group bacterium]
MTTVKTVALIGRTNVGKSTLFNRLIEEMKAMISDSPGTTRDRNEAYVIWRGNAFKLIDTGGIDIDQKSEIERHIVKQISAAVNLADVVLLAVDGQTEPQPQDRKAAELIRRSKTSAILVINKIDNQRQQNNISPRYHQLGLKNIAHVSGRNGRGTGDLLDIIHQILFSDSKQVSAEPKPDLSLAIIGKPNVGKSSLVNALVGEERAIVTPIPYTTRESHDSLVQFEGHSIRVIDTAGLRKKSKIYQAYRKTKTLEKQSAAKALASIRRSDVVLLVIDLNEPLTLQDRRLAQEALEPQKGLILVANKSDLLPEERRQQSKLIEKVIHESIPFLSWAPVVLVSAKTKLNTQKILPLALAVQSERNKTIKQAELTEFIQALIRRQKPPLVSAVRYKSVDLKIAQTNVAPPTFLITTDVPGTLPEAYMRYLEKNLRERFGFLGTPIKLHFKKYQGRT